MRIQRRAVCCPTRREQTHRAALIRVCCPTLREQTHRAASCPTLREQTHRAASSLRGRITLPPALPTQTALRTARRAAYGRTYLTCRIRSSRVASKRSSRRHGPCCATHQSVSVRGVHSQVELVASPTAVNAQPSKPRSEVELSGGSTAVAGGDPSGALLTRRAYLTRESRRAERGGGG